MRLNFILDCVRGLFAACLLFPTVALGDQPVAAPDSASPTSAAKAPLSAYRGVGSLVVQNNHLAELGWDDAQINSFLEGARAAFKNRRYATDPESRELYESMARQIQALNAKQEQGEVPSSTELKDYIKEVRTRLHLQQSPSGLLYGIKLAGSGARPAPQDTVVVSLSALAADGATPLPILSSARIKVKVSDMLPGLVEGLQMMTMGSQATFLLPPDLSFGGHDWPNGVDRGTPIFFDVTLFEVQPATN